MTGVSLEIIDNFLDSQKEVINSMQSAWDSVSQSTGIGNYWTVSMMGGGTMMPFLSPHEMTNIYARTIGAMAGAYVTSTRMATIMIFAGLEVTRATTNYARQNAKEAAPITTNTFRAFAQTAKETVQVMGEEEAKSTDGGITTSSLGARETGSEASSFEYRASGDRIATNTATLASEGEVNSSTEIDTTTTERTGSIAETTTTATTLILLM